MRDRPRAIWTHAPEDASTLRRWLSEYVEGKTRFFTSLMNPGDGVPQGVVNVYRKEGTTGRARRLRNLIRFDVTPGPGGLRERVKARICWNCETALERDGSKDCVHCNERACLWCGGKVVGRSDKKSCSGACREAWRAHQS